MGLVLFVGMDFAVGWLVAWRIFHPFPREASYLERSETLGFRPIPGSSTRVDDAEFPGGTIILQRNDQRLRRDDEVAVPKPADTLRVLVIGDSHTDGMADNAETYPAQLQAELRAHGRPNAEALNAGVGRYSPHQCLVMLREDLLRFEPDVVIAALYVGNDLLDLLRPDDRPHLVLVDGAVEERPPEFVAFAQGPLDFWRRRSLLYRFYRDRFDLLVERAWQTIGMVQSLGGSWTDGTALLKKLHGCGDRPLLSQSLMQTAVFAKYPQAETRAMALLGYVVEQHLALARQHGYDLRFLLVPTRVQVEPQRVQDRVDRAVTALELDASAAHFDDRLHNELLHLLGEHGGRVVDPRAAMREAAAGTEPLYWNLDDHVNARGCAVLGRVLAEDLADLP
ncbi:MAG: hypothetical protein AAF628_25265 [Planctomycetota bacterium]